MQRKAVAAVMAMTVGAAGVRGADPSPVAPYVDEQTVMVARVDVGKIDLAAMQQAVEALFTSQHLTMPEDMRKGMNMGTMLGAAMLARFKALGGGNVYALVAMPDVWPGRGPLALLIPVGVGGDAAQMEAWAKSLSLDKVVPGGDVMVKTLPGNVVFAGSAVALRRLETLKPHARPDIEQRLTGSTGAITVVDTGTPDMRRVVEEMMPRLPEELGGGATAPLVEYLADITLEISLPPAQELTLTAHTGSSVEAAEMLADLAKRALDAPRHNQEKFGPGGRDAAIAPQVMALLDALQPQVTPGPAASAAVHLSAQQLQAAERLMMPVLGNAREHAARVQSMSNLRQIALACNLYMSDRQLAFPSGFDDLKTYLTNEMVLTNPRDPQHRRYVLERWTRDDVKRLNDHSAEVPIAYEAGDERMAAVAFLDGHVEMEDRAVLKQQLAKAQAASAK